ncbi:unnamed protein product [Aphanomyces euteiches]
MSQGVAMLANLEEQRVQRRARYATVLRDEPDDDPDSSSPVYDGFLETQGPEAIHSMTNFSPAEFSILWAELRTFLARNWNTSSALRHMGRCGRSLSGEDRYI